MGLAAVKVKQRFGLDPRNTKWAKKTDRFGHQYLEKLGWKPGSGIGLVSHAITTHVKVQLKDDTVGLGAKLSKKEKKDEFDSGECAGLDVFQRILGRLNGREEKITEELDRQRKDNIINGKWSVHFIKGDTLKSTWDSDSKKLLKSSKKRKRDEDMEEKSRTEEKKDKKKKKLQFERKEMKERKEKKENEDKKHKKQKKQKKYKKVKKIEKKGKKEKREEIIKESILKPIESREESPTVSTRLSVRSKWIKQKRASTMDAKALNEIFMITN